MYGHKMLYTGWLQQGLGLDGIKEKAEASRPLFVAVWLSSDDLGPTKPALVSTPETLVWIDNPVL